MQPNNQMPPLPSMPPSEQFDSNQFDFIMNPQKPQKKGLIPPMSPKQRMFAFIGVGGVGLILILMLASLLFGGSPSGTESTVAIAQQQTEIVRIASLGNQKAGGTQAKTLAALTASTISSDQKKTIDYLAKQNRKVKEKELRLKEDKKADADLTAAESNGRFDEVFTRILIEKLNAYKQDLQSYYSELGPSGKALFDQHFKNVDLILKTTQKS